MVMIGDVKFSGWPGASLHTLSAMGKVKIAKRKISRRKFNIWIDGGSVSGNERLYLVRFSRFALAQSGW
jgi:hypothetical protein